MKFCEYQFGRERFFFTPLWSLEGGVLAKAKENMWLYDIVSMIVTLSMCVIALEGWRKTLFFTLPVKICHVVNTVNF